MSRLAIARQQITEHFARLATAVNCPCFKPQLQYSLGPECSSREFFFWESYRQEFTIHNTHLPAQRLVVALFAVTAQSQQ